MLITITSSYYQILVQQGEGADHPLLPPQAQREANHRHGDQVLPRHPPGGPGQIQAQLDQEHHRYGTHIWIYKKLLLSSKYTVCTSIPIGSHVHFFVLKYN